MTWFLSPLALKIGISLIALSGAYFWHSSAIREAKQEQAAETRAEVLNQTEAQSAIEKQKYENRIDELEARNDARDKEIAEEQKHRAERDRRIEELGAKKASAENMYNDVVQKYNALKAYNEKLLIALKAAGVEKLPEFNGGLPDSIKGWHWDTPK